MTFFAPCDRFSSGRDVLGDEALRRIATNFPPQNSFLEGVGVRQSTKAKPAKLPPSQLVLGTGGPGASVAFRLRQLSEGLRAFPTDRQGQQRVELTCSLRRLRTAAICAFETFERRLESQLLLQIATANVASGQVSGLCL